MYVTKDGKTQKIQEDTYLYWASLGWSPDVNQDGVPDSTQGGAAVDLTPYAKSTDVASTYVPLLDLLPVTTSASTALTAKKIQPCNATAASLVLPALPALSGLAFGTTYAVSKTDTSLNTVTVPYASGQGFTDTSLDGSTSHLLSLPGTVYFQVVSNPSGTGKMWRVVNHVRSDATLLRTFAPADTVVQLGNNLTGTVTIDLSTGHVFAGTIVGDVTLQLTNWPAGVLFEPTILLTDTAGGHAITVPGVSWSGGTPNFVQAAGGTATIVVRSSNGGTTVMGDTPAVMTNDPRLTAAVPNTRKVNGQALSSDVTLSKTDIGLGNVTNTAPADLPVSTATSAAITAAINALINSAPGTLDTLGEIAAALANDETAATALTGRVTTNETNVAANAASLVTKTNAHPIAAGQETMPRWPDARGAVPLTSGVVLFKAFEATRSEAYSKLTANTRGTAATAANTTLARLGLYSVAADGSLTLIAGTVNDTAMFGATFYKYIKAITAGSFTKGQRYAIGNLWIGSGTQPLLFGCDPGADPLVLPWPAAQLTGQTDLPATVSYAALTNPSSGAVYNTAVA